MKGYHFLCTIPKEAVTSDTIKDLRKLTGLGLMGVPNKWGEAILSKGSDDTAAQLVSTIREAYPEALLRPSELYVSAVATYREVDDDVQRHITRLSATYPFRAIISVWLGNIRSIVVISTKPLNTYSKAKTLEKEIQVLSGKYPTLHWIYRKSTLDKVDV